jgi:hypothetical protein
MTRRTAWQIWNQAPQQAERQARMTPEQEASAWRGWREAQVEQDDRDLPAREAFSAGVQVGVYHMQSKPAIQSLCELAMALAFFALVGWLVYVVAGGLA